MRDWFWGQIVEQKTVDPEYSIGFAEGLEKVSKDELFS
jgi:hypothetical protein